MRMILLCSFTLTLLSASIPPVAASDQWPSWRGPGSRGSTSVGTYPVRWSTTENVVWKVALPGKGCSTPIVWNRKIIATCPIDAEDGVICWDWQGEEQWRLMFGTEVPGKHRNGSGSNPSPVTDGESIFVLFKSGNLAGLSLDGESLWQTNLRERFGEDTLYWDFGTSPVLTATDVVVAVMQAGDSYLAAFDKDTGDLRWKVAREYSTPVEGDHSYATPIVIRRNNRELILVWGAEHLTAHDAADGSLRWSCGGFNPDEKQNWVAVASAVVSGDVAVVPYGRGERLAGIALDGAGDVTQSHRLWTRRDTGSFVPTPAALNGKVYLLKDRGEIECIDVATGETLWSAPLPKDADKYYASPVVADGKIYTSREDGVVVVSRAAEGLELLSENDLEERLIASPVPVANRLLLRGERHLFCIAE